ncbi:MAG: endonuclease MutS2, partial [Anaeromyxobacteraceae bacterium]
MIAHPRTLEELGWPLVLEALGARCRTAGGKARAAALPFLDGPAEVREALSLLAEARSLSESQVSLPISTPGDPAAALERAAKGGMLEPLALRDV